MNSDQSDDDSNPSEGISMSNESDSYISLSEEETKEQPLVKDSTKKKNKAAKKQKQKALEELPGGLKLTSKMITQLTETEKLFQSNLYKFQIQELLQDITVPAKVTSKMESWVNAFNDFLETIKPSKLYPIDEHSSWLGDVKLPLPEDVIPREGAKGVFKWIKPAAVSNIGSWHTKTEVYGISTFDIALQIPKECLNNSDYLNHKYHVKRAMYLTYLAIKLRRRGDQINFIYPGGNPLTPALQIVICSKRRLKVRIHCVPSRDLFKTTRFTPDKNNLRFEHFFGEGECTNEYSTPNYNMTIMADLFTLDVNDYVRNVTLKNENFCHAVKLLKVWLQNRFLNQGFGSFSNFIMTMFVCFLAERKKINNNMSSYQIIRIIFVNLIQTDWTSKGISFSTEDYTDDWKNQHDVIFLNSTNQLNFTAEMSRFTYNRVKVEAKLALDILNTSKVTGFQSLFLAKVPFFANFDHILQIKVNDSLLSRLRTDEQHKGSFLNHSGYFYPIGVSVIGRLIESCLKQRIQMLDVELPRCQEWELTASKKTQVDVIRFGMVLQYDLASRLIEKCEPENEQATKNFKELWRDKSVLRRFRDGSMVETVTFENATAEEKSRACFLMLKSIFDMHLGLDLDGDNNTYYDNQLERIVEPKFEIKKLKEVVSDENHTTPPLKRRRKPKLKEEFSPISTSDINCFASESFDHLSKLLRQLDTSELPLAVTSVQGTASVLRSTNVYPTPPQSFYSSQLLTKEGETSLFIREGLTKVPKYVEPIGVIVQLEGSGKWPDDINAIQRLKCAFLIRIGSLLKEQFGLCVQIHPNHMDVLKDGFVFRIRLTYYRELILLKQLRGEDGVLRIRDNPKSRNLERQTLLLPQLTSTLHALNNQFGAFGKTCRLAKRWVTSHLLMNCPTNSDDHDMEFDCRFTEESIELIVAFIFLQYAPNLSYPNEAQAGFVRFLSFLANTNWKSTSIIVNFNRKLSENEVEIIESEFVKKRDALPLLFIATPEDKLGSAWTKNLSPVLLIRASALAKRALGVILDSNKNGGIEGTSMNNLKRIFKPDLAQFDALIWIKKDMNPRKDQGLDFEFTLHFNEYKKRSDELIPVVGFDPIQLYLGELRSAFDQLCLFLHNQLGGQFIAVIWKPNTLSSLEFKVSNAKGRASGNTPKTVAVDVENTVKLFKIMGARIVDRVEVLRAPTK